jgi:hypothetical protein
LTVRCYEEDHHDGGGGDDDNYNSGGLELHVVLSNIVFF